MVRADSANGQDFPFGILGPVNLVSGFRTPSGFSFPFATDHTQPLYLMKTKMQNIKNVYFCTK